MSKTIATMLKPAPAAAMVGGGSGYSVMLTFRPRREEGVDEIKSDSQKSSANLPISGEKEV